MWPKGSSVEAMPFLPEQGLSLERFRGEVGGHWVTPAAWDWDIREASDLGLEGWEEAEEEPGRILSAWSI